MPDKLDIHVGFHYLGAASRTGDLVLLQDQSGPLIHELSRRVRRLTVVAYDPLPVAEESADVATFPSTQPNIDILTLGPKGSWRNHLVRRRTVPSVVEGPSREWDVLIFWMVNRRAQLVLSGTRCNRIVAITSGYEPEVMRQVPMPIHRKAVALAAAYKADHVFRTVARAAGLVYGNSEMLLERYSSTLPQMRLLRTAARSRRFTFDAQDRLDGENPHFLIAGRLVAEKGIFEAMEAFAALRATRLPGARLDVVGAGAGEEALRKRAQELGAAKSVTWHGWIPPGPQLFERFASADALLFLSYAESLPFVVWEAMAHSTLVIATRVGSLPVAFSDGVELLFADLRSPDSAVAAVERLLDDPQLRRRILAAARARAREATVEGMADALTEQLLQRWPDLAVRRAH